MNAEIKTWFPTSIYTQKDFLMEEERSYIENEILTIDKTLPTIENDWQSDVKNSERSFDVLADNRFERLKTKIIQSTTNFAKELGSNASHTIHSSWYNIYYKDDFQEYHNHPNSIFSAVYNVTSPKDSGLLVFENPVEEMITLKNHTPNELSYGTIKYNLPPNTLIIFRSNIRHMVTRCKNTTPRITIAANLK
jgi:uncharacterized protein (TIGR02466 family)